LPSSLAMAILERFTQLPMIDQEILSYAAVIGRSFAFPLLTTLCGLDESELVGVLRRAMNVQLISEVSSRQSTSMPHNEEERYQFRHALTREAIYDQMLPSERRLRHRHVAETLEKLTRGDQEGPVSAEEGTRSPDRTALPVRADQVQQLLAVHYWLAGLPERARPYA
jgi:predicted ATPase